MLPNLSTISPLAETKNLLKFQLTAPECLGFVVLEVKKLNRGCWFLPFTSILEKIGKEIP